MAEGHVWKMRRILTAALVILSLSAVFAPPAAYCQSKAEEGSPAEDLLIKSEVETAISMLQAIYSKHQRGELTLEQAKKLGADLLRELRYGKDGYFWADTTEGVSVVLYGKKDFEGKNRLGFKDAKGKFIVKDFIAKAKAGGGYMNYWFPKMNQSTPLPKRSYVRLFKPFGWVIGTGYYLSTGKATKDKTR